MCVADGGDLCRVWAAAESRRKRQPCAYLTHCEGHLTLLLGAVGVSSFVDRLAEVRLEYIVSHILKD